MVNRHLFSHSYQRIIQSSIYVLVPCPRIDNARPQIIVHVSRAGVECLPSMFFSLLPHRPIRNFFSVFNSVPFAMAVGTGRGSSAAVVPCGKYLFKSVRDIGIIRFPCVSRTFPLRSKRINEKIADETRTEPLLVACALLTCVITTYIRCTLQ